MQESVNFEEVIADRKSFGGKKSDIVYEVIKRMILYRGFTPETQLREQELAGQFRCSQGTIREALMRLADDGLVERSGYRGTRVTGLSQLEAVQMVRVRLSIERAAAREIQRTGLAEHRAMLEEITEKMDASQHAGDYLMTSELDRSFHDRIVRAAGMELLSPILQRCSLHIHRYTIGGVEVPRDNFQKPGSGEEHRLLLEDLSSRDGLRAEKAVVAHLRHVLVRWAPSLLEAVGSEAFIVAA
ncbi:GntR family transcriptional regulator [Acidimangrovimonas sediminis]|uniref:GntR family transcriptional regulator n=1 Tax=Acidimangrovimonas sediminis TaxID=2056283 RepID=UPI000C803B6B|nr:GntR family transcriptional regulator [Acidimangrovimonas sediminis]